MRNRANPLPPLTIPSEIANRDDVLFVANHSGGKDFQAMLIRLAHALPRGQLLVVHASLGEIEWPGALELAHDHAAAIGVPFIVARAKTSFFEMVERKRGPIEREVRGFVRKNEWRIVVNCTGVRAQESAQRARLNPFRRNHRNSIAGREWSDWAPIHDLTTAQVFAIIRSAGQTPHPACAAGNERLSCIFCIMGSRNDLVHGARAHPELLARFEELERRTGYTMHMSRKPLAQLIAEATVPLTVPVI